MANTTDDTKRPRSTSRGRTGERGPRADATAKPRGAAPKGGARAGAKPAGGKSFGKAPGKASGKGPGKGPGKPGAGPRAGKAPDYKTRARADRPARDDRAPREDRAPGGARPERAERPARPPRAAGGDRPFRERAPGPRRERAHDPRREGEERPARARAGEGRPARSGGFEPRGRPGGDRPGYKKPGFKKPFPGKPSAAKPRGEAPATRLPPKPAREDERIAKAIARAGVASRRDAEEMIEAGRVSLNGAVLTSPAVNVTASDRILIDGEPLPARERTRLWLYHKPRGLVTTARDPEGRRTVFEGLPEDMPRVVTIGRLDINTEGLLLLTNDGGLARVVAHPDTGWLRRYRVRAYGQVTQDRLDALREGVIVDGMEYGPIEAKIDRAQGDNVWITMGLREGKNREVKRVLEELGLQVNRLIRLSFGPFQLGDLKEGAVEEVRTKVLKEQLGEGLAAAAGVDFESPVREPVEEAPRKAPRGAKPASRVAQDRDRARFAEPEGRGKPAGKRFGDKGPGDKRERPEETRPEQKRPEQKRPSWDKPRASVWRAAEKPEDERKFKARRGGETAKAERAAGAERLRERVGKIAAKAGRVLVERVKGGSGDAPRGGGERGKDGGKRPRKRED